MATLELAIVLQKLIINYWTTCFDWETPCTSTAWIYKAVNNATEFEQVYFHFGKSQILTEILLNTYISFKKNGSRQQDKATKR